MDQYQCSLCQCGFQDYQQYAAHRCYALANQFQGGQQSPSVLSQANQAGQTHHILLKDISLKIDALRDDMNFHHARVMDLLQKLVSRG